MKRGSGVASAGAGANIGLQIGDDGVVVVDAGSKGRSDAVLAPRLAKFALQIDF